MEKRPTFAYIKKELALIKVDFKIYMKNNDTN